MRILLLNPPAFGGRSYVRDVYCAGLAKGSYCWPPLDLVMVSGTLASRHEVQVLDAQAEGLSPASSRRRIREADPEAILFLTSSASRVLDLAFMEDLAGCLPETLLVMMGDLAVTRPLPFLEGHPYLHGALLNHLDPGIVDCFARDGLRPTRNVVVRTRDGLQGWPRTTVEQPRIPPPRHDLFPLDRYRAPWARRRLLTSTTTSDGCPHACGFCTAGLVEYVQRPVEDVLVELSEAYRRGVREVYFQDFLFNADRDRTMELCRALAQELPDLSWCCLSKVGTLDTELLRSMAGAGCHTIQLGLESGSDRVLARMGKGFTVDQTRRTVERCAQTGMRVDAIFMLGYPGESLRELRATIELALELPLHLATFVVLTPSYGTPLVSALREAGLEMDLERAWNDTDRLLPVGTFPGASLRKIRELAERRFFTRPSQCLRLLGGVRSLTELRWLAGEAGRFLLGSLGERRRRS